MDISTLAYLKKTAIILGHWDSDPFDNYKPKRHDNRRNSESNLSHQNHYYQKLNLKKREDLCVWQSAPCTSVGN